jgi:hypothetical protein
MTLVWKSGATNPGTGDVSTNFFIDPAALQCYSMERQRRTCKLRRIKMLNFPLN